MKRVLNYLACTALLFVAIALILGGGLWPLCGFAWCFMLYISGVAWPKFWKMYWISNIKILARFNCL